MITPPEKARRQTPPTFLARPSGSPKSRLDDGVTFGLQIEADSVSGRLKRRNDART